MAKRSGSKLGVNEAVKIAKKLQAEIENGTKHEIAFISYNGKEIAHYGIRRGSKVSHSYIPKQLYISETEAVAMASCTMSRDQYIKKMKLKGIIPSD